MWRRDAAQMPLRYPNLDFCVPTLQFCHNSQVELLFARGVCVLLYTTSYNQEFDEKLIDCV